MTTQFLHVVCPSGQWLLRPTDKCLARLSWRREERIVAGCCTTSRLIHAHCLELEFKPPTGLHCSPNGY
ncbi:hypothetical protein ACCO45_009179 [Purpureocillium lilacinum]|uniref:Uncharacterized protein n=1 Tax=Purpureocillium lilacinum TaxID=33203 RepID=A0ACC4DM14_PURLI